MPRKCLHCKRKKKQCPFETLLTAEAAFHEYSGTLSSAERAFKHALLTLAKDKSKTATRVDAICNVVRAKIITKLFDGMRDLGQTVIADLEAAADEARGLGVEKMIEECETVGAALKKKLQKVFTTTQATEFKRQFKAWWPNRGVLEKLSATLCKISPGIADRSDGNPFRVFLEDHKF